MDILTLLLFGIGLAALIVGAELLVRGASRLAVGFGISPLVVGLTVVAFGTSSPELAVSLGSTLSGQGDMGLGNVVGSNIFNVLFILGLSALIRSLVVARQLVRLEVPLMIGVSVLMLLLSMDGRVTRLEGALLFVGLLAYIIFAIYQGRKEGQAAQAEATVQSGGRHSRTGRQMLKDVGMACVGLVLLVFGAQWLVNGAAAVARGLGLSELIIGLTIIAAGTSLPEVATSVIASIRGERDIAVGNVVGSNLFNILAVLGLTAAVSSGGSPSHRPPYGLTSRS